MRARRRNSFYKERKFYKKVGRNIARESKLLKKFTWVLKVLQEVEKVITRNCQVLEDARKDLKDLNVKLYMLIRKVKEESKSFNLVKLFTWRWKKFTRVCQVLLEDEKVFCMGRKFYKKIEKNFCRRM